MITKRDKDILRWVENCKSITIDQCAKLFFKGNKMAYDQARKRLKHLDREGALKRYRRDAKSEAVYYIDKLLKVHDLKILDVIIALRQLPICKVILQKKLEINKKTTYIADAATIIDDKYAVFIEVDYTHYTNDKKIADMSKYFENKRFSLCLFIIVRQTVENISIEDVGRKGKIIYVNWDFNSSDKLVNSLRSLLKV